MNYSFLKDSVYSYLSYRKTEESEGLSREIEKFISEIASLDSFKSIYAEYDEPLPFLENEPYKSFSEGASGYFLLACTLGIEIDRKIKRLSVTDAEKMLVFNACANAYLEYKAEEFKKTLGERLSYTFCPGYQGSALSDIKYLFDALKPEKIGIELSSSYMMIPQKSIAGIVAIGIAPEKKCGKCVMLNNCAYRKVGKLCYG